MVSPLHEVQQLLSQARQEVQSAKTAPFAAAQSLEKNQEYYTKLGQSDRGKFLARYYKRYEKLQERIRLLSDKIQAASNEKKSTTFAKELEKLRAELTAFAKELLALKPDTHVILKKEEHSVLKMKSSTLEERAHLVCALLGKPTAIPQVTKEVTKGFLQPLIENGISYQMLVEDETLMALIEKKIDKQDRQDKLVIQALIGAWDLHPGNAMAKLVPSNEAKEMAQEHFHYLDNLMWKRVTFFELLCLQALHKINDKTLVCHANKPYTQCSIEMDKPLQKALKAPWKVQVVLFDNERTLGGEKIAQSGNRNSFNLFRHEPCLPCRLFFLGTPFALEPLTSKTRSYLCQLPKKITTIEKRLSIGDLVIDPAEKKALIERLQAAANYVSESKQLTFYGLVCRMYPHFNFILDLLVQISATVQLGNSFSLQDCEKIKGELLLEKRYITLPKNGVIEGLIISTSCQKIIDEALALKIITVNDPCYQAAMKELQQSKPL